MLKKIFALSAMILSAQTASAAESQVWAVVLSDGGTAHAVHPDYVTALNTASDLARQGTLQLLKQRCEAEARKREQFVTLVAKLQPATEFGKHEECSGYKDSFSLGSEEHPYAHHDVSCSVGFSMVCTLELK